MTGQLGRDSHLTEAEIKTLQRIAAADERKKAKVPYLVRGATLRCRCGTHTRRLNLPLCHGVYAGGHPLVHKDDCLAGTNISPFGICQSATPPPATKGQTVTLPLVTADGSARQVTGQPCLPSIVGKWMNCHPSVLIATNDSLAAGADPLKRAYVEALTTDSFLVCGCDSLIEPVDSGQEWPAVAPVRPSYVVASTPVSLEREWREMRDLRRLGHGSIDQAGEDDVKVLQLLLNTLDYKDSNEKELVLDGNFGSNTLAALNKFKDATLPGGNIGDTRGVVGPTTWAALLRMSPYSLRELRAKLKELTAGEAGATSGPAAATKPVKPSTEQIKPRPVSPGSETNAFGYTLAEYLGEDERRRINAAIYLGEDPGVFPVEGKTTSGMNSAWGDRLHHIYKTLKMHRGTDISAPNGTKIYNMYYGLVKTAYSIAISGKSDWGNHVVVISAINGKTALILYAHMLEAPLVAADAAVTPGDSIGLVGNTGESDGNHLHVKIEEDGVDVNPDPNYTRFGDEREYANKPYDHSRPYHSYIPYR